MSVGKVLLSTTSNHLGTYDDETDGFIIPDENGVLSCKLYSDIYSNIIDCKGDAIPFQNNNTKFLNSWRYGHERNHVIVTPDSVQQILDSKVTKYRYQPEKVPILGCCSFPGYVVTVTSEYYTVCNLKDLTTRTNTINEIKKCTAVIAGWHRNTVVDKRSMKHIDVLICDGSKVYHYVGDVVSVIDTGRVLTFCKTEFGYLAAFETNWRLSPLHLFGDQPINLESLEIPRNHTSSNEARLQLYGWEMDVLDDKHLPGHNEPTLLVEKCNVVCVSGFYKHVISMFFLKNGTISHIKDISIGLENRCAGLAFRKENLLVLKRRFDSDNILLTFPSKSGNITGDVIVESIKLEDHIGNIMGNKKKSKHKALIYNDSKKDGYANAQVDKPMSYPKFIRHNITDKEIEQKAQEILAEYRSKPPSMGSFSDSELSEGTLEILADCRPRHPFIPIPVSDSSDDDGSELLMPGKLILPTAVTEIQQNTSSLIKEVCRDTLTIPKVSENITSEAHNVTQSNINTDCSKMNEKLDKIINLLERQNVLLEMIARQSLVDKK